jgi:hypothetical protein
MVNVRLDAQDVIVEPDRFAAAGIDALRKRFRGVRVGVRSSFVVICENESDLPTN